MKTTSHLLADSAAQAEHFSAQPKPLLQRKESTGYGSKHGEDHAGPRHLALDEPGSATQTLPQLEKSLGHLTDRSQSFSRTAPLPRWGWDALPWCEKPWGPSGV